MHFRRSAVSVGGLVIGSLLLVLGWLPAPAGAFMWLDAASPDYVKADLAWGGSVGTISWQSGSPSAQEYLDFDPTFSGQTASYTNYQVPYYTGYYARYVTGAPQEHRVFEFTSPPLVSDLHLNGSRLVQVHLVVKSTARQSTGGCADNMVSMDLKLFLDDRFIGGARGMSIYDTATEGGSFMAYQRFKANGYDASPRLPAGLCLLLYGIPAEEAHWPAGGVVKMQFLYRYQTAPVAIKMSGEHRSHVAIPVFSDVERSFRFVGDTNEADAEPQDEGDEDGAAIAAGLLGVPLVALGRLGPRRTLVLLLVLALFSAGCFGHSAALDKTDDGQVQRGEVEQTIGPGSDGGPNGTIIGVVIDEFRRPVPGAHVSVLGHSSFARSDGLGRFQLSGLAPGKYSLRVDRDSFRTFESNNAVEVLAGKSTYIEITLYLLVRGEGGAAPHDHDYWPGPTKVLAEDMEIGSVSSSSDLEFGIPGPQNAMDYNSVLPGTALMLVTLKWDEPSIPAMALEYANSHKPAVVLGRNATYLYPRASGETYRIPVTWEMQDPGHQHFSSWTFRAAPHSYGFVNLQATAAEPFTVRATIEIVRGGRMPIEAPHIDRWGGNLTAPLGERNLLAPYCSTLLVQCTAKHGDPFVMGTMNISFVPEIVPVGTEWIEVKAAANDVSIVEPATYKLLYKGAASAPNACRSNEPPEKMPVQAAKRVSGSPSGKDWVWRIDLQSGDGDPFYARSSAWCLWIYRDSATYAGFWGEYAQACTNTGCGSPYVRLAVNMTAFRSSAEPTSEMTS